MPQGWGLFVSSRSGWFIAALGLAALSARPYAGGWNDGSRLATVECLVDYHSLAIDRSIFVAVPNPAESGCPTPYEPTDVGPMTDGTGDKLLINGHFYSDKSPVPAVLMAGIYRVLQLTTGLTASERPDRFCYWMTFATSGLALVITILCWNEVGFQLGLRANLRISLLLSFGLGTVAPTYAEHVNNHIVLLAVASGSVLALLELRNRQMTAHNASWLLLSLGGLSGLSYAIDLGAGPVMLLCALAWTAWRFRRMKDLTLFVAGAIPWLILHHALNYAVGGTFKPANAVPEYFNWPGCTFSTRNMTGAWNHPSVWHLLVYSAGLLYGKRGFLGHCLPLVVVLPALGLLIRRRRTDLPEVLYAAGVCGGVWLAYALASNNYSGVCCSIRWFLPLLAPGHYLVSLLLRERVSWLPVMAILAGWGFVLSAVMWWHGPFIQHMVTYYWPIQAGAILTLAGYYLWRRRCISRVQAGDSAPSTLPRVAA
jgi:hypothetical protein